MGKAMGWRDEPGILTNQRAAESQQSAECAWEREKAMSSL